MSSHRGLTFKLVGLILSSTTLVFFIAFAYNYHESKKALLKNVEESARNLAQSTVYKIETTLQAVQRLPCYLAATIENQPYTREEIERLLRNTVASNSEIFGAAIAFEPHAFDPGSYYYAPYCYRDTGIIRSTHLGGETYRYFFQDWYQIPRVLNRPLWSEPYFDEGGGNIIMSTFSVPFYRHGDREKEFWGVVTADISLLRLKDLVSAIKLYKSGHAFLVSQNGVFITHPNPGFIMTQSVFSLAEALDDNRLREIGKSMIRGREGFELWNEPASNRRVWIYHSPLPSSGWALAVLIPEDELLEDIRDLSQEVVLIAIAGFLGLFLVIALVSGTITRPLRVLARTTAEIARGNLDIDLPVIKSQDEVGALTGSFRDMKVALKEYIATLAETTAAKERIESELKIARTIQMSFLPKHFPPFPEKDALEISTSLVPAKEVGGDLYDFYPLGSDRFFFAIGDVSDKGVPAALFMAVTKTLLKGMGEEGITPSELLAKVNGELCRDNDAMMFVTIFCGILNVRTGELLYSNAGHNPPLLWTGKQPVHFLKIPAGTALGVFEEARYKTEKIRLEGGDLLLAYTDGVTEAMDVDRRFYTEERLLEAARIGKPPSAAEATRMVMESVRLFSTGAPQADDIALLALQYKGAPEV